MTRDQPTDIAAILDRLRELEDREAIRALKAEYCRAGDDGHDADRFAAVFAEDGVFESEAMGQVVGRDALRSLAQTISMNVLFMHSIVSNSVITIDGDSATGAWNFLGPIQLQNGDAVWTAVRYDELYVRVGETWRIKHLKVTKETTAPFPTWGR